MTLDVNELWMQVHQGLRTFIAQRVPNDTEADDILQEVFLRMHRRLDSLKDPRRVVSWVFQITRNAIADFYRAPNRRREVAVGLASDLEATHSTQTQPFIPSSTEPAHMKKELAACLRPLMDQLSDPYREAVMLVELDGLTQQVAAKQLGLSLSGMKSRVQRGRKQLKRLLEECCVIQLDRRRNITDYTVRDSECNSCGPSPAS